MKNCPVCDTGYPDQHRTCPTDGAVLIESQELAPASLVRGKYRITRKLGQGGMGTVYLAEHLMLGGRVALKFLAPELSRNPQFIKRFRNEARAAFQLRNPNIVEVMDLDQAEDGSLFIAMEYVDGPSLRAVIRDHPNGLPVESALTITRGIASGLAAAHARGTVHRDIKPENILLVGAAGREEQPKVLDFGIAAMLEGATAVSHTRGLMLTPEYASPEQWRGTPANELDGRTDLYALGCVLYQMLTGQTPFHAHNIEGWMFQHLQEMPQPPSQLRPEVGHWPGLDELVMRLLAKNRDDRLQCAELIASLDALLYGSGQEHPAPQAEPRWDRPGTVIEEGWNRPQTMRTQAPAATQNPASVPDSRGWEGTANLPSPQTQRPQSFTQTPAQPPLPEAPTPKAAPHKFPIWAWGALAVVALAAGLTAVHFLAPQTQPQQVQTVPAQPLPAPTAASSTAPQTQPAVADDPKNDIVADANPNLGKQTGKLPDRPSQTQPTKSTPAQTVVNLPAVHEPSAGDLSQQAIAPYQQKNYTEAAALFDKACAGGASDACKNLGTMYRNGNGVQQDYSRAVGFYDKACKGGSARSCANLGFLYANGTGVIKDDARATQLYTTACNGGDGMGCSNLGNVYANGRGVPKDPAQAAALYLKACSAADASGCSNLGSSYRYGNGVDRDLEKAKQFLDKGCKMGNQWGCDRLKELQ
ncbi:MAG: protein kinase [Terracidiphilus sp.]